MEDLHTASISMYLAELTRPYFCCPSPLCFWVSCFGILEGKMKPWERTEKMKYWVKVCCWMDTPTWGIQGFRVMGIWPCLSSHCGEPRSCLSTVVDSMWHYKCLVIIWPVCIETSNCISFFLNGTSWDCSPTDDSPCKLTAPTTVIKIMNTLVHLHQSVESLPDFCFSISISVCLQFLYSLTFPNQVTKNKLHRALE